MKKIITYGTFDLFHIGHLNLIKRAKAMGDHLTVVVSTDEFNKEKNKIATVKYEDRKSIVEALIYVDAVIPECEWDQKIRDVVDNEIDVFVIGADWRGKFDFLSDYCEVVYLERTPGVSTTEIKTSVISSEND